MEVPLLYPWHLQAVEKKFPEKFFYAGWMGPERYALLAGCDFTLLPSRWSWLHMKHQKMIIFI